jgi:DegV family protein with EDD domain
MAVNIGLVVDSTADFPSGMTGSLGLHVIPIHIVVDSKDYLHGIDISNQEVLDHLAEKSAVKTAPPVPTEYADLYERLFEKGKYDRIVSFHVSNELSNCYKSAKNALNLLSDDIQRHIKIIDTRNATIGQALVVKRAVEIIRDTVIFDNLADYIKIYMDHCVMLFTVDNLYWLKRSGKANLFSAFIGGSLDMKPIVGLKDGKLHRQKVRRGIKAALEEMALMTADLLGGYNRIQNIWIGHADAMDHARYLETKIREEVSAEIEDIQIIEMGPTISAHTGPGAVCLSAMPDKNVLGAIL